jgi:hypothetical protein
MSCKHAQVNRQQIPQLGGPPIQHVEVHCALKLASAENKLAVYDRLFQLGLEGSMLTTICPVAGTANWAACPFREV